MKTRKCPSCQKILEYENVSVYNRAVRLGKGCRSCGRKNSKYVWNRGLTKDDSRVKHNCRNAFGKNGNFSTINKGKTYEQIYGIGKSKQIKQKQSNRDNWPNYNKESIKYIEEFGRKNGYNFQHAENGGEVMVISKQGNAYYLDGYDKKNNFVVEYYEKFHKRQQEYDKIRQQESTERLGCDFHIIWEKK
jgi:hypothetical protein